MNTALFSSGILQVQYYRISETAVKYVLLDVTNYICPYCIP